MKKIIKSLSLILAVVLVLSLSACGASKSDDAMGMANDAYFDKMEYDAEMMAPENSANGSTSGALDTSIVQTDRKIIYSAWATIQTKEYDNSVSLIKSLCEKYNTYFESSSSYGNNFNYTNSRSSKYVIRVPVENYSDFLEEVGSVGSVLESGENNKDVTEQYYDTEARLESAKMREERVLVLLENAGSLDDILSLERELADIRYEIESYTGTLRKLDSLVSYATFTLTLEEVIEYTAPVIVHKTFGERLAQGFKDGWNNFVDFWQDVAVDLSYATPALISFAIFVLLAVLIIRASVKSKKKKATQNAGINKDVPEKEKVDA